MLSEISLFCCQQYGLKRMSQEKTGKFIADYVKSKVIVLAPGLWLHEKRKK